MNHLNYEQRLSAFGGNNEQRTIIQNKPNLLDAQMSASPVKTKNYEQ